MKKTLLLFNFALLVPFSHLSYANGLPSTNHVIQGYAGSYEEAMQNCSDSASVLGYNPVAYCHAGSAYGYSLVEAGWLCAYPGGCNSSTSQYSANWQFYLFDYFYSIPSGKNFGAPLSCSGNPINNAIGNKYQQELVYQDQAFGLLNLFLYYNSSLAGQSLDVGRQWRTTFDRNISLHQVTSGWIAEVSRPDGKIISYKNATNTTGWVADKDITEVYAQVKNVDGSIAGHTYTNENRVLERYSAQGKLSSITYPSGAIYQLSYDTSGRLFTVIDPFGRTTTFTYGNDPTVKITLPSGNVYGLKINSYGGTLSAIVYPDGTQRQFAYEDVRFPYALTGITDESGTRFATYQYDTQGRAVSTGHAGGADLYQLQYNTSSTVITDPLGTQRTQNFQTILGVVKSTGVSQPGGAGCGAASANLTYDANGNVATRTDFNGNLTAYSYDLSRNLETQRIEAQGKPEQRTISTTWHPTYRLQTGIAEANKITTFSYDTSGNLLSKSEQATSDANGSQGFNAGAVGSSRTWSWTYTTYGRKTSATDPLGHVTSYTYFSDTDANLGNRGNLASITNPLGQTTRITAYDGNSRPLSLVDANGVITQLTYSPRGWLTSRNVGGETTAYTYDGVGQLSLVTAPDGSTTSYTYDGAHRLTGIADSLGNRITYTLDAMGNRIGEDVTDPSGQLAQTLTRNYDALGRLQSLVGVGHE